MTLRLVTIVKPMSDEMQAAFVRRDALAAEIEHWTAPVLSDERIENLAVMYLASPLRRVMPFFAWVAKEVGRWL